MREDKHGTISLLLAIYINQVRKRNAVKGDTQINLDPRVQGAQGRKETKGEWKRRGSTGPTGLQAWVLLVTWEHGDITRSQSTSHKLNTTENIGCKLQPPTFETNLPQWRAVGEREAQEAAQEHCGESGHVVVSKHHKHRTQL